MTIKLSDFVAEALSEIVNGVKTAQEKTAVTGAVINATVWRAGDSIRQGERLHDNGRIIQDIEFDIAIALEERSDSNVKIGVVAGLFGGGASAGSGETSQISNRIKFRIPLVFPRSPN